MKKILFITDTWSDRNINGVATWIRSLKKELEQKGHIITIVHPDTFLNVPMPAYRSIRLSIFTRKKMKKIINEGNFDIINIVTEGPLGLSAKKICRRHKIKYNTYYHTNFPKYVHIRLKLNFFKEITYSYLKWFHKNSNHTVVTTETLKQILEAKGLKNIKINPLGVDTSIFKRNENVKKIPGLKYPVFTYVGRIAPEKNIEAFLKCNLPGTKIVIGDGPTRRKLEEKYSKDALFLGEKIDQKLVDLLSQTDVLVFPSKTDTFGLIIIEAMACGVPVAAYDILGPRDIIINGKNGYIGDNLEKNAIKCLNLKKEDCIKTAEKYSWQKNAERFLELNGLI